MNAVVHRGHPWRLMHALHKHPHTNTHLLAAHTYNILPCFERIRGPAQRPLHELFVINERARGLLLQWSSEGDIRAQKTTCKKLLYCMRGLNFVFPKHVGLRFQPTQNTDMNININKQLLRMEKANDAQTAHLHTITEKKEMISEML